MDKLKPTPANSTPLTPLGFLERAATAYGDCTSLIYNSTVYTWSLTHSRCLRLASSLLSVGIRSGQVVSVVAPNIPPMFELHFAVPFSGAVLNNINTRLDAATIAVLLRHSGSRLVFVDYHFRRLVIDAMSLLPANCPRPLLVLIADDGEELGSGVDSSLFVGTYEELVSKGDPGFEWVRPENEWDPIVLNYTSGTTASPKGVVHCHRGTFIATVDSLIDWSVPKHPVFLWTLPMFHSNGWCFTWGMAAVGAVNICLRRFDAADIYAAIRRYRVTHMCGAPVVLTMLSNMPNVTPLKSPVHFLTAGAPPPASILHHMECIGFVISHGYGLTETGGIVVSCAWKPQWNKFPAEERAKLKTRQGIRTIVAAKLDVIDPETGKSVQRNGLAVGEIVLRGGSIMLGYLNDPKATSRCMGKDGWFRTGDVGVMHPDGYIEIKDRSKDIIISGGENISSIEVESVLYTNPTVREVAVVARPDEYWGETPCAFINLKEEYTGKVVEREVIEYCRARMPHYMVPKTLIFTAELPKTATGKILKFVLREMAKKMGPMKTSRL